MIWLEISKVFAQTIHYVSARETAQPAATLIQVKGMDDEMDGLHYKLTSPVSC